MVNDKVRFTPLQMDNLYRHFEWNNDPELNRLDSEVTFARESLGDFKRRFEQMVEHGAPSSEYFEIHTLDGTLIGVAEIADLNPDNQHCLVSITIGDRSYWGEGYGRASMDLLLHYCFDGLHLHRVGAETFEYNTGWQKLVEGSGFQQEGVERDFRYLDDTYWDKITYAMLEHEYRDLYKAAAA